MGTYGLAVDCDIPHIRTIFCDSLMTLLITRLFGVGVCAVFVWLLRIAIR
jgi:hypothetical protein